MLAPLFLAGIDGPEDLDSYMMLSFKTLLSDLKLLSILDEVGRIWLWGDTNKSSRYVFCWQVSIQLFAGNADNLVHGGCEFWALEKQIKAQQ